MSAVSNIAASSIEQWTLIAASIGAVGGIWAAVTSQLQYRRSVKTSNKHKILISAEYQPSALIPPWYPIRVEITNLEDYSIELVSIEAKLPSNLKFLPGDHALIQNEIGERVPAPGYEEIQLQRVIDKSIEISGLVTVDDYNPIFVKFDIFAHVFFPHRLLFSHDYSHIRLHIRTKNQDTKTFAIDAKITNPDAQ